MRGPGRWPCASVAEVTPAKPRRTEKTERQRDQRQLARDRSSAEELRRRTEQPDVLPVREDEGRYVP